MSTKSDDSEGTPSLKQGDSGSESPREAKERSSPAPSPRSSRKKRRRRSNDPNLPKQPLSAYNIFFRDERMKWLRERQEEQKTGKGQANSSPTFCTMGKVIGSRWQALSAQNRARYEELANLERERYHRELAAYRFGKQNSADPKESNLKRRAISTPLHEMIPASTMCQSFVQGQGEGHPSNVTAYLQRKLHGAVSQASGHITKAIQLKGPSLQDHIPQLSTMPALRLPANIASLPTSLASPYTPFLADPRAAALNQVSSLSSPSSQSDPPMLALLLGGNAGGVNNAPSHGRSSHALRNQSDGSDANLTSALSRILRGADSVSLNQMQPPEVAADTVGSARIMRQILQQDEQMIHGLSSTSRPNTLVRTFDSNRCSHPSVLLDTIQGLVNNRVDPSLASLNQADLVRLIQQYTSS